MAYSKEFISALNLTTELNLSDSIYTIDQNQTFGSSSNYIEIRRILTHIFPEFETHGLANLCVGVSCFMKPYLEKLLGSKLYITNGYYLIEDEKKYHLDKESAIEIMRRSKRSDRIDFHTWLTLPSLEIIDLTLVSSLARKNKDLPHNDFIFIHPDNLKALSYHPVIIGEAFLEKSKYWSKEIFQELSGFQY